jgi:streptogramin lyase
MASRPLPLLALLGAAALPLAAAQSPLKPLHSWPLAALAGAKNLSKFDHLLFDAQDGALYVSAKAIDTFAALDAADGKVRHSLALASPQGIVLSKTGQLWVGSDVGGNLTCIDPDDFTVKHVFHFTTDTDDIKMDPYNGNLYVSSGDAASGGVKGGQAMIVEVWPGVPLVNAHNFFSAHVEGFALVPDSPFIVASTPDVNTISVLNKGKNAITATWNVPAPLADVTPLIFDNATQVVIAAARTPGALVVFDYADGGKLLATVECECGDADDISFDAASKTVFVSSGAVAGKYDGSITAFTQVDRATYKVLGQSRPAGKTHTFDAKSGRLFTAVPDTGAGASIEVYQL